MRRTSFFTAAAVVVLATAGAAHAGPNLITNGGFETGDFTGWTVNGNSTSVESAGGAGGYNPNSGSFYAALGNIGDSPLGTLSQTFSDDAGSTLNLSLFLNSNGTTPNQIIVEIDGITLFSETDIPNSNGYFEVTGSVIATGSDTLTIFERDDPDWIALDDVSVTESVPEPASFALFGASLLGLGWLRRRHG
jgi:hypothetical protein